MFTSLLSRFVRCTTILAANKSFQKFDRSFCSLQELSHQRTSKDISLWKKLYEKDYIRRKKLSQFLDGLALIIAERDKNSIKPKDLRRDVDKTGFTIQSTDTDSIHLNTPLSHEWVADMMKRADENDTLLDVSAFRKIIELAKPLLHDSPNITLVRKVRRQKPHHHAHCSQGGPSIGPASIRSLVHYCIQAHTRVRRRRRPHPGRRRGGGGRPARLPRGPAPRLRPRRLAGRRPVSAGLHLQRRLRRPRRQGLRGSPPSPNPPTQPRTSTRGNFRPSSVHGGGGRGKGGFGGGGGFIRAAACTAAAGT